MANRRRPEVARVVVTALLFGAALLARPSRAEAQGRGTLQVTAQVVDTKASFDGLQAARSALRQVAAGAPSTNRRQKCLYPRSLQKKFRTFRAGKRRAIVAVFELKKEIPN